MTKDYSLIEFLEYIAKCNGDEALNIITKFQCGAISIEDISIDDLDI